MWETYFRNGKDKATYVKYEPTTDSNSQEVWEPCELTDFLKVEY